MAGPEDIQMNETARPEARRLPSLKSLPESESGRLGALLDSARYSEVEERARHLLERLPESGVLWKVLGASLQMQGKEVLPVLQRVVELLPDDAEAHYYVGSALEDQGQIDGAMSSYRRALELDPDFAEAHCNLGAVLRLAGKLDAAIASCRRALEINPFFAEAYRNQGNVLLEMGQPLAAVESQRRALEIRPDFSKAHNNLGIALQALGHSDEAVASYRRALEIDPDFVNAHSNLGIVLQSLGRPDEALISYRRALEINSNFVNALNNLGITLQSIGRIDEAMASYRRALEIDPNFAVAHSNLGGALREAGQLGDAEASCRRAIEINADYAEPHLNLGNVMRDLGRLDNAVASYTRALEINPNYSDAHCNILFARNYISAQPAEIMLAQARLFGEIARRQADPYTDWPNLPAHHRCLRVGFVSGDLRNHPVGYFVEGVLSELSLSVPESSMLIAYSNHVLADEITERIRESCHIWRSVVGMSDERLARQIREDGIDILIDLSGHTAHNRLPLFAWKPAPVQLSWLGYFATTGLATMDYLIADPWTLPEAEEDKFTEKVWRLPETRLCFTPPKVVVNVTPLPALAKEHILFGCFHNLSKINDAVIMLWARVLQAVPGSCLLLKTKQLENAEVRKSIVDRFAANNIDASRLILEGFSPRAEYLAAYQRVDIVLDTFPFPGGTTTAESLWMGVPVLTLAGESFLARQGLGLLMNAGLPDWIGTDADDYVARAIAHTSDLPGLAALRAGLRQQVLDSPIFDAPRFAGHFEAALRGMWLRWCDDQVVACKQESQSLPMKTFLHVGCGSKRQDQTTRGFNAPGWQELRLDINPNVNPDIVGTMLDMPAVADESVDALFSAHNIEHLYPHEVPFALAEFRRVLKADGFAVITCPDLQSVCQLIADDKLTEPAYNSPAGPIAPLDILYGHRASLQQGNLYMAHRCGFTEKVLVAMLQGAGFAGIVSGSRGHPHFDLWAVASKAALSEEVLAELAEAHFPE